MIKGRLIGLLSHSKKYVMQQVLWQWLSLVCQIVIVFQIARLLTSVLETGASVESVKYPVGIIIVGITLRFVFDKLTVKASFAASFDVKRILREKIYNKLLRLGAAYREKVSTAEVVQMSVEGVEQLEIYFGRYLAQFFYSMITPITLFIVLFRISFVVSLVLLLCVPLIPLSIVVVQKIAKKLLSKYWDIYTGLGDSFLENLQGMTTLKIYKADEKKAEEMDEESELFRKITMKVLTMQLNSTSVMDIMAYGSAGIGMILSIREFVLGNTTLTGTLIICLLAAEFFIPLRTLGSFFHIAMNGMAASDKIFALLDIPEDRTATDDLGNIELEKMAIKFSDVSFSYEEDREILKNIDVEIPFGGFVSLVGESGSGKSTIAGILMGRNKDYRGSITVGGLELSEIEENSIMENITMISTASYLFKGTVEDNLRIGKPDATENELMDAIEKVGLKDFLMTREGLQTELQEGGNNFSGGQKQKVALARALLHDSPIYIFDECTSNIDVESEEKIMDVIHDLANNHTVILISHRLANVVDSDCIYALDKGEIEERGKHEDLLSKDGQYANLFNAQRELEGFASGVRNNG